MALCKFIESPVTSDSGKNVEYITRDSAVTSVSFFNIEFPDSDDSSANNQNINFEQTEEIISEIDSTIVPRINIQTEKKRSEINGSQPDETNQSNKADENAESNIAENNADDFLEQLRQKSMPFLLRSPNSPVAIEHKTKSQYNQENSVEALLIKQNNNPKNLQLYIAKVNAVAFAEARLIDEKTRPKKSKEDTKTHYRLTLSWDRRETAEKVKEMSLKFLKENFPKARAIVAIHENTDHIHSHIWIDARQIDDKKVSLHPTHFKALDESFARIYDEEYGTNFLEEHREKKAETKFWKELKKLGIDVVKPARGGDKIDTDFYRQKDERDAGLANEYEERRVTEHQRNFENPKYKSFEEREQIDGKDQAIGAGATETVGDNQTVAGRETRISRIHRAVADSQRAATVIESAVEVTERQITDYISTRQNKPQRDGFESATANGERKSGSTAHYAENTAQRTEQSSQNIVKAHAEWVERSRQNDFHEAHKFAENYLEAYPPKTVEKGKALSQKETSLLWRETYNNAYQSYWNDEKSVRMLRRENDIRTSIEIEKKISPHFTAPEHDGKNLQTATTNEKVAFVMENIREANTQWKQTEDSAKSTSLPAHTERLMQFYIERGGKLAPADETLERAHLIADAKSIEPPKLLNQLDASVWVIGNLPDIGKQLVLENFVERMQIDSQHLLKNMQQLQLSETFKMIKEQTEIMNQAISQSGLNFIQQYLKQSAQVPASADSSNAVNQIQKNNGVMEIINPVTELDAIHTALTKGSKADRESNISVLVTYARHEDELKNQVEKENIHSKHLVEDFTEEMSQRQ